MSVIPFTDTDEVVRMANDSRYGLAAAVWTSDMSRALTTARAIRAGVVWVNDTQVAPLQAPWGGFKESASAASSGRRAADYVETKPSTSTAVDDGSDT